MYKLAILFGCIVLTVPCAGGTVSVNWDGMGDYTTIQAGIDAANPGDTVIVTEGTYVENISFGGKNVILTSTDPDDWSVVAGTVIDGSGGAGPVVLFAGTEEATGELAGFTITGGYNTENGGGVQGSGSYASISKCIITGNTTENTGGGVQYFNGDISNCKIIGNSSGMNGGGLAGCQGRIENCVVSNNTATTVGGGMNNCDGEIVNCTIANNSGGNGGGLRICDGTITNCIIWGNSSPEIYVSSGPTYSCFVGGGGNGNIDADPMFVNGALGDYHLQPNSLCIDAGTNSPPGGLPSEDFDGNSRPQDGDHDGVITADMGTYEIVPTESVIGLSANQYDFTVEEYLGNPAEQILSVSNYGVDTLSWTIEESCDWLTALPDSGSSMGEPDDVTLSVDISGLSQGNYSCDLMVSDPNAANSPQTVTASLTYECIFNDSPMYDDWVGVGKPWNRPDCWCYERHCRGDADGKKIGLFWVQTDDLAIFASAFAKPDFQLDQTKICGDFDHKKVGMFRVQTDDLAIFASYFSKTPVNVPVCPLDWDGDGDDDYNFWVTP